MATHGALSLRAAAKARLEAQIRESNRMFLRFRVAAETILRRGGTVAFEWPRLWDDKEN